MPFQEDIGGAVTCLRVLEIFGRHWDRAIGGGDRRTFPIQAVQLGTPIIIPYGQMHVVAVVSENEQAFCMISKIEDIFFAEIVCLSECLTAATCYGSAPLLCTRTPIQINRHESCIRPSPDRPPNHLEKPSDPACWLPVGP